MRNPASCVPDLNSFVSCPGDSIHITYSPVVRDDGTIKLMPSGKEDIQSMIDSYRPLTDISYISQRLAAGDTSVLDSRQPMFGDFVSGVPKTYAEALQLVIDGEKRFNDLPLDVRNRFDNDFRRWFATAGSEPWLRDMAAFIPAAAASGSAAAASGSAAAASGSAAAASGSAAAASGSE